MKKKLIVLDFDGTIIKSGRIEKFCRNILKKIGIGSPPRIFFMIGEIIDFFSFLLLKKAERIIANEHIIKFFHDERFRFGIITDRRRCSLCRYLKVLGIGAKTLFFIQARKSIFDSHFCEKNILRSQEVKPDIGVYNALIFFIRKSGYKKEDVVIVDDSRDTLEMLSGLKMEAFHPDDPKLLELLKPESSLV